MAGGNAIITTYSDVLGNSYQWPLSFRNDALLATPQRIGDEGKVNWFGYNIINPAANAYDVFVKFWDINVSPTVGTDTPVWTLQVAQAGSIVIYGADMIFQFNQSMWWAVVRESADNGTTAPGTGIIAQAFYRQYV